ncbi:elongation factor 2 kinase, putative [Trichoderma parareesei]|uniref:Elongation factor 2 kinase, putative n=1 Tax=Trichoderma parareesei TaxID=858221 RepID=A0A2H3A1F1_TRIPA|nr:elongation factor 2 kinase, putative [Trichoderma parareesei]
MADRVCSDCNRCLDHSAYTNTQWARGVGWSRCFNCVQGFANLPTENGDAGRYNHSSRAEFTHHALDNPIAEGSFRWVAKGKSVSGPRSNQACVTKWFKTGAVFSKDFFRYDILAVDKALELVNRFNQLGIVDKEIKINVPQVWTFEDNCRDDWAGQMSLVEPFIQNYQKFNSNTGWNNESTAWGTVMQALSHFSYHATGGFYVLCDLQGGIYQHEVVLSDPVILSRRREFGVTDLGPHGISSFFSTHECDICHPNWTRPANPAQYFRPERGTFMMNRHVPTAHSRPLDTIYLEDDE